MEIPQLSKKEIGEYLLRADDSPRRRCPKILHKPGDELNKVFNFMMPGSYMQPHRHPHEEKIEEIYIIQGRLAVLFFDGTGTVTQSVILEKGGRENIEIPAFAWHTYVVLSQNAVSYETMKGVYDPATWKELAAWAPPENMPESAPYLEFLKKEAIKKRT